MFHVDRWAGAFFAVLGENADAAFLCLKALAPPVKSVHGVLFGHSAAAELEKILRESAAATETTQAVEYAICFICLLVEKNCFRYIDLLLTKIEQTLDERKGILDVTVESAAPPDSGFEEGLTRMIKEKTGAAGIKIKTNIKPELLGGYVLRIGGFYVDASLKGQIEKMTAELT
ncbi:MAG: F0F1 ATP synthase subunit delta [Treponema sp.]|nr:F0F1 ATP synthase subunit delta [Treponema sp.]